MTGSKRPDGSKVSLSLHEMLGAPGWKPRQQVEEEGLAGKKGFQPYHSRSVPKSQNLEAQANKGAGTGGPVRTMMLRNIPNKYAQTTLLEEIDLLGFAGTYDFFYLPMDVHNRSNVGYAFINFISPEDAERFRKVFSDHRFQRFQSRKVSSVCSAHVQGLDENLRHFENRAVTHARNDQYRPIVLAGNQRIDFEEAVAGAKMRAQSGDSDELTASGPASASSERSSRCLSETGTPPAGGAPVDARQGLEDAIRNLLTSIPVAQQQQKGCILPPPGLYTEAQPGNSVQGKCEDDIDQLLSLRSLLVERLVEKEHQVGPNFTDAPEEPITTF